MTILLVLLIIGAAGAVFFTMCYVLRLEEMHEAFALVQRKISRPKNRRRNSGATGVR